MRRIRRKVAALGVTLLAAAFAFEAEAAVCTFPKDEAALGTRLLQTELMVAALSCRAESQYNAFVGKFQSDLVPQGLALRAFFARIYGTGAEHELTSFVTALANERSAESLSRWPGYCREAQGLFAEALALEPGHLAEFALAQPFGREHGFAACPVTASAADASPAPAAPGRNFSRPSVLGLGS